MANHQTKDLATFDVAQFCQAIEHSPIGTAVFGLDGVWLNGNAALRSFLGYDSEELKTINFRDVTHPDDLKADLQLFEQLTEGRIPSYEIEKRYIRKDGGVVWAVRTVSLVRSVSGEPLFYISHVQDISDRKSAEAERLKLADRAALAARAAQIGIWELDVTTHALAWSPEMFDLFLTKAPERLDLAFFTSFVLEEDREALQKETAAALDGMLLDTEFRIRRADGEIRYLKGFGSLERGVDGAADRLVGANWDVTEMRRLTERAEAANRAKSQFLAVMSHELRTPMNGILGMTQAMLADPLPDIQRERLNIVAESGAALLTILNDILDLSKVEAGKMELESVAFDLEALLENLRSTYSPIAGDQGLTLALDIDGVSGLYGGDPTRLRQILSNLISNSLKFTTHGRIDILARQEGRNLILTVADTGVGMTRDVIARIFKPFAQADASTTRQFGGTGLGLSIVHELTQLMQGEILVDSRPGVGSRFTVRLPLPRLGPAVMTTTVSPVSINPEDATLRILAAEDNAINQLVLKTLLGQFGIEPKIVENGAQAVEAWLGERWDVVLMDIQMPVLDGFGATRAIREREIAEGLPRVPIIALTANAMPHQRDECIAHGMDAVVAKPIDVRALISTIEAVVGQVETSSICGQAVA
ncbi:PAS domain S-box protein [Pseudomonas sp. ODNR1LW]|nr:PAS domain S-box protein [Pseudomonas sp. ODNR1LW]